jgi:pimeloyl-ACP methyl ester carboxylesterase
MNSPETIVLIHGLSDSREVWTRQVPFLRRSANVIAYDVRGFGASPVGAADGTVRQMADDLAQLLSAMASGPAWLVGFSMGGVIDQRFALDFADRVAGLVLVASSCKIGRAGVDYFRERIDVATNGGLEALAPINAKDARACLATTDESLIAEYQRLRTGAVRDVEGYLNACRAMQALEGDGLIPELGAIGQPTSVIAGEHDPFCPPRASEMIAEAIPGASLTVVPDAGHCLHIEASDTLNQLIRGFIDHHGQGESA